MNKWWGYLHTNGTIQAKRYFDEMDIAEAKESDFVARIVGPFPCNSRAEALEHLSAVLDNSYKEYVTG